MIEDRPDFLDPPEPGRYTPEQAMVARRIAAGPRGGVRGPLALWLHSPEFAERAQRLGELLRFGTVFARHESELAILVVARHWRAGYVWCVHEPIALREGVPAAFVEALRHDPGALPDESPLRCIAEFVRQLARTGRLDDTVRREALQRFGQRGCVELAALAGYYTLGAFTLAPSAMPMPDDAPYPFAD